MQAFAGIYAAAITPRGKRGDIDFAAAFELLDHLARGRLDGVAIFTSAGEYPAFSLEDRSRLVYLACKRSRLPIWAGVGSASLDDSLRLAREARSAGVQALLLPPPLLLPCSQDVLREFYLEFAGQMDGDPDIFVCNVPGYTATLDLETELCLMQCGQIAGIADASGDRVRLCALNGARASQPFALLAAHDRLLGSPDGAGAISTCACAIPELAAAVHRGAVALAPRFFEFLDRAERLPPTVAVRMATGLRGLATGACAFPLPPRVLKELDGFREWFRLWLPSTLRLLANA
jgi:4-hydroxy-tetrahydrodipicolinate synthase